MKRFISFGSIEQFSTVVKNVKRTAQFVSYNEETKEVIVDKDAKMPVVTATGSEKIHGTNAAVCYSEPDGFWVQSRKNIITPEKDNAGCAFVAYENKDAWMEIILALADEYDINLKENIISVYYEWAGGNIQKNACVSGYKKSAFIFQFFKVSPVEPQTDSKGEETAKWLETGYDCEFSWVWIDNVEANIYNVMNFPHYEIEIDFERPDIATNKLIDLVENTIETESPLGKALGLEKMTGEGVVVTFEHKGNIYRFKAKGEKHAKGSGKVKTLKPVDEELENKKIKFVNEVACQEFRLDQMFTEIQNSKYNGDVMEMSNKDIGDYLRLVVNDVIKEHSSDMAKEGLEPKMINGMISKVARSYFMDRLNKEQM
jgi:hypothetical protein